LAAGAGNNEKLSDILRAKLPATTSNMIFFGSCINVSRFLNLRYSWKGRAFAYGRVAGKAALPPHFLSAYLYGSNTIKVIVL
jgi:hypothetical protein